MVASPARLIALREPCFSMKPEPTSDVVMIRATPRFERAFGQRNSSCGAFPIRGTSRPARSNPLPADWSESFVRRFILDRNQDLKDEGQ
mgnify:CR=1 FL=1